MTEKFRGGIGPGRFLKVLGALLVVVAIIWILKGFQEPTQIELRRLQTQIEQARLELERIQQKAAEAKWRREDEERRLAKLKAEQELIEGKRRGEEQKLKLAQKQRRREEQKLRKAEQRLKEAEAQRIAHDQAAEDERKVQREVAERRRQEELRLESSIDTELQDNFNKSQIQQILDKVYDSQFDIPAPAEVRNVIQQILNFLCTKDCGKFFIVRNPTVIDIRSEQIGTNESKIIYSSKFIDAFTQRYGPQATFGIFAHEIGHHIGSRVSPDLVTTPWDKGLRADELSGCAIAMAGFTTGQLESAILNEATYPSHSHPSSPLRIKAIRQGYLHCGGDISDFRR